MLFVGIPNVTHGTGDKYNGKEFSMLDEKQKYLAKVDEEQEMVALESLANLTGFPVELIKKELFNGQFDENEISMSKLRAVMADYLDSTMLEDNVAQ